MAASEHVVSIEAHRGHQRGLSAQGRTLTTQSFLWPLSFLSLETQRLDTAGLLHIPGGKRGPRGPVTACFPYEQP